jgi:hypothetical protein
VFSSQLALAQFSQQGPKLVGTGAVGGANQGYSVALSGDGNTTIVGGPNDNSEIGAAWVYTRSGGVWTLDRFERFQITFSSPFPGLLLALPR